MRKKIIISLILNTYIVAAFTQQTMIRVSINNQRYYGEEFQLEFLTDLDTILFNFVSLPDTVSAMTFFSQLGIPIIDYYYTKEPEPNCELDSGFYYTQLFEGLQPYKVYSKNEIILLVTIIPSNVLSCEVRLHRNYWPLIPNNFKKAVYIYSCDYSKEMLNLEKVSKLLEQMSNIYINYPKK